MAGISPAAQNRLDHLRREADSGQLTVTSFIRRACKVFFTLEEVSRGGIGLLDEKKLDIILTESRRYYPDKATESLVKVSFQPPYSCMLIVYAS